MGGATARRRNANMAALIDQYLPENNALPF
jgi:hypothetical protein